MSEPEIRNVPEVRAVRAAAPQVPRTDPAAMERARARLQAAFEAPGPRRHRRLAWVAVAAVIGVLALALGLSLVLPPGGGGPSSTAARELEHLAATALAQPGLVVPDGSYLYTSTQAYGRAGGTDVATGASYAMWVTQRDQLWEAPDGSGQRVTTVTEARFASPEDRATWIAMGSPPRPEVGKRSIEYFAPGEIPFFDLGDLPTDPERLQALISGSSVIEHGPGSEDTFYAIGELLAQGTASPELRAALLRVAASLPGVRSLGIIEDPLGRRGLGFAVTEGRSEAQLIFDPETAELLGQQRFDLDASGEATLARSSAYGPPTVVDTLGAT
jgi:hypothetical protein